MAFPTQDGEVRTYYPTIGAPRFGPFLPIYYVNGIKTNGEGHEKIAIELANIVEQPVTGVYNKTNGMAIDLLQCLADWSDGFAAKVVEYSERKVGAALSRADRGIRGLLGHHHTTPPDPVARIRRAIPERLRRRSIEMYFDMYNDATSSLFHQLAGNRGLTQRIVAHSQGNLITANALWAMVLAFGEDSLDKVRVYSLASPAPAWPMGIRGGRRKVYGHTNDLVTLADPHNWRWLTRRIFGGTFGPNPGDWRSWGEGKLGIEAHDVDRNMALNFTARIRSDLGLGPPPNTSPPDEAKP